MNLNGLWWNPSRDGEGFPIIQRGNEIFMYWYTYDNQGHQNWYMCDGQRGSDTGDVSLQIYLVGKGRFLHPDPVDVKPWGTGQLIVEGDKLRFMFSNTAGTLNRIILLERLA